MNIIKSICLLCKEKKPNHLKSTLISVIQKFISQSSPTNPQLLTFLSQFSQFKPSLKFYPSTEIELNTQASESKLEKDNDIFDKEVNMFPLKAKKKNLVSDPLHTSINSQHVSDFSIQDLKRLLKVFTLLNSKKIKILILLMENKDLSIRKLSIIFFQILLFQSKSKIHFVEKCALGYSPGLYCLTRLKYLQLKGAIALDVIFLLDQIKGYVKTMVTKIKLAGEPVQGIKFSFIFPGENNVIKAKWSTTKGELPF